MGQIEVDALGFFFDCVAFNVLAGMNADDFYSAQAKSA